MKGGVTPPEDTGKTPSDEDDGDKTSGEGGAETPGGGNGDSGSPDDGNGGTKEPGGETGDNGNPDNGNGGIDESDGGNGDAGSPDNGNGDAENPDGGNGDAGNPDDGNSGTENPGGAEESGGGKEDGGSTESETHSDSVPEEDGGTEQTDETARVQDGALPVQSGVFVMPVYLSEPVAPAQPQTLERKEASVMITGVIWQSDPAYDGNVEGTYIFTAILPGGYTPAEGVSLPQITVTVQGEDPAVQELLARIAALPETEEYLAEEPDVEEKEEYEAWMEELSAYAEEALAIWEAYETLTVEQQARIPAEALAKLTAWVELAEQLAEGSQVMTAADGWTPIENSNLEWQLTADGTLTIRGSGAMPDWGNRGTPWDSSRDSIKSVIIKDGVTNIGANAFYQCSKLTSIEIPSGVTSIGGYAFFHCSSLTSVTIPSGVTSIGSNAFYGCSSLTSVAIPKGVTSIGGHAFGYCQALTSMEIPNSVTSIGASAFLYCEKWTNNIKIPAGVTSIADYTFGHCESLTSIDIPDSVTSIGNNAFSCCTKLASIKIPEGVTSIGNDTFRACAQLTNIEIPAGVTSIGNDAFIGCSGLTSITIPEKVESIGNTAFRLCAKLSSVRFTEGGKIPTLGTDCFSGCPCVAEGKTGLDIPSCSYLTASGWSQYKNNVTQQHTMTHTDNGLACSGCGMTYSATINAENCNVTTAVAGGNYTVTFTPNSGYNVPTEVTVKIGSTTLGSGDDYTYTTNSATGTLRIPIGKITGILPLPRRRTGTGGTILARDILLSGSWKVIR